MGILKHKNTYDFLVQVRNFLLPLSLKVFRHKERGTIFLCWLFHLPQNTCDTCLKATGLASVSKQKSTFFFRARNPTLLTFFKIPQILRDRFRCMTSFPSLVISSIWDFYFDICERHIFPARASTPALKFAPN